MREKLTNKAIALLQILPEAGSALPASAIARKLWPDKAKQYRTSLSRGGLYRAAGAFCSRLERKGLVRTAMLSPGMPDFGLGYAITEKGLSVLRAAMAKAEEPDCDE